MAGQRGYSSSQQAMQGVPFTPQGPINIPYQPLPPGVPRSLLPPGYFPAMGAGAAGQQSFTPGLGRTQAAQLAYQNLLAGRPLNMGIPWSAPSLWAGGVGGAGHGGGAASSGGVGVGVGGGGSSGGGGAASS